MRNATAEDVARLDFYEGGFGYRTAALPVAAAGASTALVYLPPDAAPVAGEHVAHAHEQGDVGQFAS